MERLTDKRMRGEGFIQVDPKEFKAFARGEKPTGKQVYHRLLEIEDILGDDYDLDRLRELVEADREGRCTILSTPERLMVYENLECDIDPNRLLELVEAGREGRCIIVPVKPGGFVRFKGNPRAPHEKVDGINIYADGKIMLAFHEYGVKETFVDEWSEDEAEKYISVEEE